MKLQRVHIFFYAHRRSGGFQIVVAHKRPEGHPDFGHPAFGSIRRWRAHTDFAVARRIVCRRLLHDRDTYVTSVDLGPPIEPAEIGVVKRILDEPMGFWGRMAVTPRGESVVEWVGPMTEQRMRREFPQHRHNFRPDENPPRRYRHPDCQP